MIEGSLIVNYSLYCIEEADVSPEALGALDGSQGRYFWVLFLAYFTAQIFSSY